MSDESEGSTSTTGPALFDVAVKCLRPTYRRAGLALVRGQNLAANVTAAQLAVLKADPNLSVVSATPAASHASPGGMDILDGGGELNARIRAAVAGLDSANPALFTQGGQPKVTAVSEALGETITAAQLKAALAEDTAE